MIITYTGNYFDFTNIKKENVHFEDIFHSLPHLNRFVGHSSRPYSVAEHTINCVLMAEKLGYSAKDRLLVLIHDFTEAYVGDCPSPLKRLLPAYSEIEAKVEHVILERLGLEPLTDLEFMKVKKIDYSMLVLEMRDLTLHDHMKFVTDNEQYVYEEFLGDDDFQLDKIYYTNEELRDKLTSLFYDILYDNVASPFNGDAE